MSEKTPTVVVTSEETLPGILDRLRGAGSGGRQVHLVVPIDSSLLLTAAEFRTLKEAIDNDRLAVQLRTADPLRLQLADRLGIRAHALTRPKAVAPTAVARPHAAVVAVPGVEEEAAATGAEMAPRADPSQHWPAQNGVEIGAAEGNGEEEGVAGETPRGLANPPRRWLPVAAGLVLLVAAAALGIRFVVPQAVIAFVPKRAPVTSAIVFDVSADGQPRDAEAAFAVAAQPRQVEVVWSGSLPASGVRVVPDGTAESAIELRNTAAEPVVVDAGTTVATETDVAFAFVETVTVPAADAATGEPGAASGRVRAAQPGSGGNVGTGELGGRLPNGVYYSNRMGPAAGGTDKEFPVVAQADLDGLIAAANEAAAGLAADALLRESGETILPSTVTVSAQSTDFDHQAGDDAETVNLQATMTVEALAYDSVAANEAYEGALAERLEAAAPEGYVVPADTIIFDAPVERDAGETGARLEVAARAEAEAVLDTAERAALAERLAGANPDEAAALLAASPDIAEFSVDYHPSWLPDEMPSNVGRIVFEEAQ